MKDALVAALRSTKFKGDRLDATARSFLGLWAEGYADHPIWEEIVTDARVRTALPDGSIYSEVIWFAVQARLIAESVKEGVDVFLRERQMQRDELLALAEKADALAHYFREIENYPGVATFFQQHLLLPVVPEQEAVYRIEPSNLRVQQLRKIHEREGRLLRQRAGKPPKPVTFISRIAGKRRIQAFIHLMTGSMVEICGKQHRGAVAMLACAAFNCDVDSEDVRKALMASTRAGRRR
jgi:hypothetical protein